MLPSLGVKLNVFKPLTMHAAEALQRDMAWLDSDGRNRVVAFLDPNGATQLPYLEAGELIKSNDFRRRADVIINISACQIKRIRGSAIEAEREYPEVCGQFSEVFWLGTEPNKKCWIREPVGDSWQWCILAYWAGTPPKNPWPTERFVKLDSPAGRAAVKIYTNTKRDLLRNG